MACSSWDMPTTSASSRGFQRGDVHREVGQVPPLNPGVPRARTPGTSTPRRSSRPSVRENLLMLAVRPGWHAPSDRNERWLSAPYGRLPGRVGGWCDRRRPRSFVGPSEHAGGGAVGALTGVVMDTLLCRREPAAPRLMITMRDGQPHPQPNGLPVASRADTDEHLLELEPEPRKGTPAATRAGRRDRPPTRRCRSTRRTPCPTYESCAKLAP